MLNPYLMNELRRAERVFRKRGQRHLADDAHHTRGALCDRFEPNEKHAINLIHLAFGGQIHA